MLDKIIDFSIRHKLIVGVFILGLVVWGIFSMRQLPIDAVPDITNNQVQIITSSPSNGAEDIERFVTFPIEQAMSTIAAKEEVRSFSRFGLSVVTVIFKDNIDVYWARQQVSERLSTAKNDIPAGMGNPELGPISTGLGEIYQYVLKVKPGFEQKYSDMELRSIQDWIIRRQLLGVKGIADISSFGGHLKQYEVTLKPDVLNSFKISIQEVFDALASNNQNTGGAYIDKKPNAYFIRTDGLLKNLDDIRNIVVKNTPKGIPVLIRDVAKVQFGSAIRYGAMSYNNNGETVGGLVLMLKGANASTVIKDVKSRIGLISKTLPEGVVIEPFLDRSKLVNRAMGTVMRNLTEGALIVIFVLVIFLGNFRAGLIVASVIPLSMLFAVCLMNLFGVSGNLMSLGAIDFGLIVDGAVIIVETILHQLVFRKPGKLLQDEMDHEVRFSARKMMDSAVFGQIIILIVYFPILALSGIEGKMFRPMAETVAFAIIGALLLSLTYVPMMSALCLNKKIKKSQRKSISERLMHFFQKIYRPIIKRALRHRWTTLLIAIGLFLSSLFVFRMLGAEFIPQLDEGDFAIEMRVITGSSMSHTIETTQKAAKILREKFPEVKKVIGKIGSSEIPTDPMPIEAADIMVILKDKRDWVSAVDKDDLAEKMQQTLEENIPGVTFGFQQPIQMRFNELISGAKQDLVIKVAGDNLDKLAAYALEIGNIAKTVKGSSDIYVEQVSGLPQVVIQYNRDQIAQFGLNIKDVNQVIQSGFSGASAGLIFEGDKRYDLVVRLDEDNRNGIEDIQNLAVITSSGASVPIGQLADVRMQIGPNQIQREDLQRKIMVGINVRGRDINSLVDELQQKIDKKIKFDPGYSIAFGGAFKNLQEATGRLLVAVPLALLLIFFLLYLSFKSIKQSLLIFTAIPLSAIGGVFALCVRGMPFSISAGIGFIALFGVAVLNGIVLIAEFNALKKSGMTNLWKIVLQGTRTRLRPVLMTATVASLGFLPMALSHGSGAEVQKPLATVVIGGLMTATMLTLIVLPILYTIFEKIKIKVKPRMASVILALLMLQFTASGQGNRPAREILSLEMLIQKTLSQSFSVQSAMLEVVRQEYSRKAAGDMAKTDIAAQYGQINSKSWDTYFSASQRLPAWGLPGARRRLADAQLSERKFNVEVVKNELVYKVKSAYYHLNYLLACRQLFKVQDSVYKNFQRAANLRYKAGENTLLEAKTADTKLAETRNSANGNEMDIQIAERQLQTLVNSPEPFFTADTGLLKVEIASVLQLADSLHSPVLRLLEQQIGVTSESIKVKRAEAGPEFSIGYFNQSMVGNQMINGQEISTAGNNRFWGLQAGISIPIFYKSYKNRIEVTKIDAKLASTALEKFKNELQSRYTSSVSQYLKEEQSVRYYEQNALPNAEFLRKQALEAFRLGEIQYVELLQALQSYSDIRSGYLDAVDALNQSIIDLQFMVGNLSSY